MISQEGYEYQQVVGRSAKDPEVELVSSWLIPGERVLAVASGTENGLPSWLIVTPLKVIYLHVGMQLTYDALLQSVRREKCRQREVLFIMRRPD